MNKILVGMVLGFALIGSVALADEDPDEEGEASAPTSGKVAPGETETIYKGRPTSEELTIQITCDVSSEVGDGKSSLSGRAYLLSKHNKVSHKCLITTPDEPVNCTFALGKGDTIILVAYGETGEKKTGCKWTIN